MNTPTIRLPRGPLFLWLALLVCTGMGLMAWSHLRWDALLADTLIARDRLAQSRRFAALGELHAERLIAGDAASISRERMVAELDRAVSSMRDLTDRRGELVGMQATRAVEGPLREAVLVYMAALSRSRELIDTRPHDSITIDSAALQRAYSAVEAAAAQVEETLLAQMREARRTQHRLDALIIALTGALALLLFYQLRRSQRSQEQAFAALRDSEGELRAFVCAIPDNAFLIASDGQVIADYGRQPWPGAGAAGRLTGRRLQDVLPDADALQMIATLKRALQQSATQQAESRLWVNGKAMIFEALVSPVPGHDQVVWLSRDVTERRLAENRVRDLSRLYNFISQINQTIVWADDAARLFDRACHVAVVFGGYRQAWLSWLQDDGRGLDAIQFAGTLEFDADRLRPEHDDDPQRQALLTDGIVRCDLQALPQHARSDWMQAALASGCGLCVCIPLYRANQPVAVLSLLAPLAGEESDEERRLLVEVGTDLSFALTRLAERAAAQAADERVRLHAAALESTRDGVMVTDLEGVIVSVNRAFCDITGYTSEEVVGQRPDLLASTPQEREFFDQAWQQLRQAGHWEGEMWSRRKDSTPYAQWMSIATVPDRDGQAGHYVAVFTDVTRIKQAEERLQHLAHHDTLTDLPNRLLISMRLDHAIEAARRQGGMVAVLFIDLDQFKTINDSLGHAAGDELLKAVAKRLYSRVRGEDTLGRQGGDEFVLVLERISRPSEAALVAKNLLELLANPFLLPEGQDVYVQASIGISLFPDNGANAADLMHDADAAMYQAKRSGRNTYRFYTEALTLTAQHRLNLETRLRQALDASEFELFYQPLVRLTDGSIVGVEVHARLNPGGPGEISPTGFIRAMEECGLITRFGDWMRRAACTQAQAWLAAGYSFGSLSLHLSVEEIQRGGLEVRLAELFRSTGFPAQRLELELTESSLMAQGETVQTFLRFLRAEGLKLSIDDFGTGYSSLVYLRQLPVDRIKIDSSFLHGLPQNASNASLTSTIIAMARNLGLAVVADGVDSQAQIDFLRERGCDAYQGNFFSAPLPPREFERRFLSRRG